MQGRQEHGVTVLELAGELDLLTAPRIVTRARDLLRGQVAALCVDLTRTSFAESAGLAALVNVQRSCLRADIPMALACPDGPVRRVLTATRLDRTVLVHASRSAAVDALSAGLAWRRARA